MYDRQRRPPPFCFHTIAHDGREQWFETTCELEEGRIPVDQVLAGLCSELSADFSAQNVCMFSVMYFAKVTIIQQPSILQREPERRTCDAIVVEVHSAEMHLHAHRPIIYLSGGKRRLGALDSAGGRTCTIRNAIVAANSGLHVVAGGASQRCLKTLAATTALQRGVSSRRPSPGRRIKADRSARWERGGHLSEELHDGSDQQAENGSF